GDADAVIAHIKDSLCVFIGERSAFYVADFYPFLRTVVIFDGIGEQVRKDLADAGRSDSTDINRTRNADLDSTFNDAIGNHFQSIFYRRLNCYLVLLEFVASQT